MKVPTLCLAVWLMLMGCETIIEIDPPDYDQELTVISYFNHDSTWSARVAQTVPIGMGHAISDPYLDAANVTVWDGDRLIDQLVYDDNGVGLYKSTNRLRPKVGVAYTMRVEAEGFSTAFATSNVPAIPSLSNVTHERLSESQYLVHFRLEDPPEENYYRFNTYLGYPLTSSDSGQLEYILDLLFMVKSDELWHCSYVYAADPVPDFEDADDLCLNGIMTDRLFNGQTQDIKLPILIEPSDQWEAPILIVMFHSLSPGFFEYKRTIQLDEIATPFSEPVHIYTNFEGARGIFAGFSTSYLVYNLTGLG